MWLLSTTTKALKSFTDQRQIKDEIGGYAILSHRWAEEEISFDEIHSDEARSKQGYRKIDDACNLARKNGSAYIWIDTCCIDKRSSAELSEAINSMFRWYQNARVCYVYLNDFEINDDSAYETKKTFQASRWWSRGWTLQELIAPGEVQFYDRNWRYYGKKNEMVDTIYDITRVDVQALRDCRKLNTMSVAKRMSWAARRETTREEDQAYSLLGLFSVNMPLLYGEGGVKAFYRLQEEIIRTSAAPDHSILAWLTWEGAPRLLKLSVYAGSSEAAKYQSLLAPSPYGFRYAHNIVSWSLPQSETFTRTAHGLRLTLLKQANPRTAGDSGSVTAMLNCRFEDERMSYITIWLDKRLRVDEGFLSQPNQMSDDVYDREHRKRRIGRRLQSIGASEVSGEKMELTLAREPFVWPRFEDQLHIARLPGNVEVMETFPTDAFDPKKSMLSFTTSTKRYSAQMNPAYGAVLFGSTEFKAGHFALSVDRISAVTQSPRLVVGVFFRQEVENLGMLPISKGVQFIPNETRMFEGPRKTRVHVTARCVIVSGDLFWSIHVYHEDAKAQPRDGMVE